MTRDVEIVFEAEDLCVSDIGAVQKRTQEEQCQNRENSISGQF